MATATPKPQEQKEGLNHTWPADSPPGRSHTELVKALSDRMKLLHIEEKLATDILDITFMLSDIAETVKESANIATVREYIEQRKRKIFRMQHRSYRRPSVRLATLSPLDTEWMKLTPFDGEVAAPLLSRIVQEANAEIARVLQNAAPRI